MTRLSVSICWFGVLNPKIEGAEYEAVVCNMEFTKFLIIQTMSSIHRVNVIAEDLKFQIQKLILLEASSDAGSDDMKGKMMT